MKEQGRQYQVTVFLPKGAQTRQFKSKKKGEAWAQSFKEKPVYKVEPVR